MSDVLCITNRSLCRGDFLTRIEAVAAGGPAGIILREKDLPFEIYLPLAEEVMRICERYQVSCILHTYEQAALRLGCRSLHMPLHLLEKMTEETRRSFSVLGASCHSLADAKRAEVLGCTYVIAGHIFPTQCKAGLAPRGLDFLRGVCQGVSIPVYAIGGICPENMEEVRQAGAAGGCVMSGLMQCENPGALLRCFSCQL